MRKVVTTTIFAHDKYFHILTVFLTHLMRFFYPPFRLKKFNEVIKFNIYAHVVTTKNHTIFVSYKRHIIVLDH